MITLIDLGHEFWRNWFGSKLDPMKAFELTIERVQWYFNDCPRTVVCCDGGRTKRHDLYAEYKATREERPAEAYDSLRAVQKRVAAWGCPVVAHVGYEADDLIATLVKQAWIEEVQILSNDKDLFALISPTVKLIDRSGLIDEAGCFTKFGVRPDQMRDFLALCGDKTDNIPGCPHVGMVRAGYLLAKFGTLQAIKSASVTELRKVPGVGIATVTSIKEWDPTLALSLVTLMDDAPIQLDTLWSGGAKEPIPFYEPDCETDESLPF